jgi:CRISPR-associated protein (TIGR02584 family)
MKKQTPKAGQQVAGQETVLFAVVGFTPAILTETIWALAHESPAVLPHRVVVVTTLGGKRIIEQDLFTGEVPIWTQLRSALEKQRHDLEGRLQFGVTADDIRVFTIGDSKQGQTRELDDLRTPAENAAAADFMLAKLREFTENPQTRIIASIAGGRKTMGALLYAGMSLLGRETDRLTHVLVNEPFDNPKLTPRFYFTNQQARILTTDDGKKVRAKDAEIELADIPFVPLRNRFQELGEMPGSFRSLVARYSADLKQDANRKAVVKLVASGVEVDGVIVKLPLRAQQLMSYLIDIHKRENHPHKLSDAANELKGKVDWLVPDREINSTPPRIESQTEARDETLRKLIHIIRSALRKAGIDYWGPQFKNPLILGDFRLVEK